MEPQVLERVTSYKTLPRHIDVAWEAKYSITAGKYCC